MEGWDGMPSLLGSYGQGEENVACGAPDKGLSHEPQALRTSATEQPALSVQCKEQPCPPQ